MQHVRRSHHGFSRFSRRIWLTLTGVLVAICAAAASPAVAWPDKTVTVVVPYAAGAATPTSWRGS